MEQWSASGEGDRQPVYRSQAAAPRPYLGPLGNPGSHAPEVGSQTNPRRQGPAPPQGLPQVMPQHYQSPLLSYGAGGGFTAGPRDAPGPARQDPATLVPAQVEVELRMRNSYILQQRDRIIHLERELSRAWLQIRSLQHELQAMRAGQGAPSPAAPPPGLSHAQATALPMHRAPMVAAGVSSQHAAASEVDPTSKPAKQPRYWSDDEHARFLEALRLFGPKDVKSISNYVKTRTVTQVRTHTQKFYLKLRRTEEENADPRGTKRRRTHTSRMHIPEDLSSIPRRQPSRAGHSSVSPAVDDDDDDDDDDVHQPARARTTSVSPATAPTPVSATLPTPVGSQVAVSYNSATPVQTTSAPEALARTAASPPTVPTTAITSPHPSPDASHAGSQG